MSVIDLAICIRSWTYTPIIVGADRSSHFMKMQLSEVNLLYPFSIKYAESVDYQALPNWRSPRSFFCDTIVSHYSILAKTRSRYAVTKKVAWTQTTARQRHFHKFSSLLRWWSLRKLFFRERSFPYTQNRLRHDSVALLMPNNPCL